MKKTWTIIIAVALVVAIAVGGTMAYLTQRGSVTNTFTVKNPNSKLSLTLDEAKTDANGTVQKGPDDKVIRIQSTTNAEAGNQYNLIPGLTVTKDPTVTILQNSCNCYVFAYINNTAKVNDKLIVPTITCNTCWKEVSKTYPGLYVYCDPNKDGTPPLIVTSDSNNNQKLTSIFDSVTINSAIEQSDYSSISDVTNGSIVVRALAYQSDAVKYDDILSDVYSRISK